MSASSTSGQNFTTIKEEAELDLSKEILKYYHFGLPMSCDRHSEICVIYSVDHFLNFYFIEV